MPTNYQSARARIDKAATTAALDRLTASFDRLFTAGQLAASELQRLDAAICDKLDQLGGTPSWSLSSGVHRIRAGYVSLCETSPRCVTVERVEVDKDKRQNGEFKAILALVVEAATAQGVTLDALIMPDDFNDATAEGMLRALSALGFKPLEMEGEIYRKDVTFTPPPRGTQNADE